MTPSADSTLSDADVVVVGLGPAGTRVATVIAEAKLTVIGVEKGLVGGECRFFGCTPSKMVVRAAELVREAYRAAEIVGSTAHPPQWGPIAQRVADDGTDHWDDAATVRELEMAGVEIVRGPARLDGPSRVIVGSRSITAGRAVVVATGTEPAVPEIPGIDTAPYLTNRTVFQLPQLPSSMAVVGAGAVGVELSQALSRLGVTVTLLETAEGVLPGEEPEVGRLIAETLRSEGIVLREGIDIERVSSSPSGVEVQTSQGVVRADQIRVATGRRKMLSGLGLDSIGLDPNADGVDVDEYLRAAPGVWAIGDITGEGLYTHVAHYQAEIAAADIVEAPSRRPADYRAVPRVTFSDPEVGAVGMTEAAAREARITVDAATVDLDASSRAWLHGEGAGGLVKLVADAGSKTLVGATVVGPMASETVAHLTLAIHTRLSLDDLGSMIYAFPSFHDAVLSALRRLNR